MNKISIKNYFLLLLLFLAVNNVSAQKVQFNEIKQQKIDIKIKNIEDNVLLEGTAIFPKDNFEKLVFLIPGSDRDTRETHPKLMTMLLENNIGVVAFDDRGIGKSTGDFYDATTKQLSKDAKLCFDKIKGLFPNKKIGIIAHSKGGMVTQILFEDKSFTLDFVVFWATPNIAGEEHGKDQIRSFHDHFKFDKEDVETTIEICQKMNEILRKNTSNSDAKKEIKALMASYKIKKSPSKGFYTQEYRDIIDYSPYKGLCNIKCPVLGIGGENDKIVLTDKNLKALENTLQKCGNNNITCISIPKLKHFLTEDDNKDYRLIDDNAATRMIQWILKQ
jgi:uncharacterized protein